jgi:hypothetical protein
MTQGRRGRGTSADTSLCGEGSGATAERQAGNDKGGGGDRKKEAPVGAGGFGDGAREVWKRVKRAQVCRSSGRALQTKVGEWEGREGGCHEYGRWRWSCVG